MRCNESLPWQTCMLIAASYWYTFLPEIWNLFSLSVNFLLDLCWYTLISAESHNHSIFEKETWSPHPTRHVGKAEIFDTFYLTPVCSKMPLDVLKLRYFLSSVILHLGSSFFQIYCLNAWQSLISKLRSRILVNIFFNKFIKFSKLASFQVQQRAYI